MFTVVITEFGSVADIRTKFDSMVEAIEHVHYILPDKDIVQVTIEECGTDILYFNTDGDCTAA